MCLFVVKKLLYRGEAVIDSRFVDGGGASSNFATGGISGLTTKHNDIT